MRFHKLFIRMSQMGSILIEIFDVKVLNEIYPLAYIYIYIHISEKYGIKMLYGLTINFFCFKFNYNFIPDKNIPYGLFKASHT